MDGHSVGSLPQDSRSSGHRRRPRSPRRAPSWSRPRRRSGPTGLEGLREQLADKDPLMMVSLSLSLSLFMADHKCGTAEGRALDRPDVLMSFAPSTVAWVRAAQRRSAAAGNSLRHPQTRPRSVPGGSTTAASIEGHAFTEAAAARERALAATSRQRQSVVGTAIRLSPLFVVTSRTCSDMKESVAKSQIMKILTRRSVLATRYCPSTTRQALQRMARHETIRRLARARVADKVALGRRQRPRRWR